MSITHRTREEQHERQRWFDLSHKMRRSDFLSLDPPELWDDNGLAIIYFVRSSTSRGGNTITCAMSVDDARTLCSDERSRGNGWTMCWTALEHYMAETGGVMMLKYCRDNGKQDGIIEELGLSKYPIEHFEELLEPLGYEVK